MKFKKYSFHPVPAIIGLSVAALLAWGLSHWAVLPFWGAFSIVVCSMVINGIIAQIEDDAPGGFNNPTPDQKGPTKSASEANKGA